MATATSLPPRDNRENWRKFKQLGDSRARAALIDQYAYLVKITAGRVVSSLPPSLDRDDLVSAGVVGLIKAVDQFDTGRQVKFETYAIALIRGAILEMLREEDWVPRSVRDRVKTMDRTIFQLESTLGRPPSEHEIARTMNMTSEDYGKLLLEAGRTTLRSLDEILVGGEGNDKITIGEVVRDDDSSPSLEAETREMRRLLALSIDKLPERERLVIALYYYEGLTFKEIGKILSISESRVYQLHTQAVLRMRGYLQRENGLF